MAWQRLGRNAPPTRSVRPSAAMPVSCRSIRPAATAKKDGKRKFATCAIGLACPIESRHSMGRSGQDRCRARRRLQRISRRGFLRRTNRRLHRPMESCVGSLASRGRGGVTHATWKTSSEPVRLHLVRLRQLPTTVIDAKLKIFAAAHRRGRDRHLLVLLDGQGLVLANSNGCFLRSNTTNSTRAFGGQGDQ